MTPKEAAMPTTTPITRKVLMSDELFLQLGAGAVDWGKPDEDGFYTPTIYRSEDSISAETALREVLGGGRALDAAVIADRLLENGYVIRKIVEVRHDEPRP